MRRQRYDENGMRVVVYEAETVGETLLRLHQHDTEDRNHITVVTRGSVIVRGRQEGRVLVANERVAWVLGEPHGLEAGTADAAFQNIRPLRPDERKDANGKATTQAG